MVLGLWFESARAMFFLFLLLNALPVPMLRQVFLGVFLMPKFNAEIAGEKVVPEVEF